jgi:hypothetical protein
LSNDGKGLPPSRTPYYGFPDAALLARQMRPSRQVQPKRS